MHTANDTAEERELDVLSVVHAAQTEDSTAARGNAGGHVSQRSIAQALGMSVGLTNSILKRLTEKGFVMMRRINHNNVHYLVTPAGIEQLSHRSYIYLRRTIGNVVRYKERIRTFCREQKARGIEEIVLVGESDLTFILEWCAEKEGLGFRHLANTNETVSDGTLQVLSEQLTGETVRGNGDTFEPELMHLREVLLDRSPQ